MPYLLLLLLFTLPAAKAGDVLESRQLQIGDQIIEVEMAQTKEERRRGLMRRRKLAENRGMLLVYPRPGRVALWMRDTPLPLSAAFLDEDGVILNIARMEPERLDIHLSKGPAQYALEMNQGWFAERGVLPGDRVTGLPNGSAE